jgi:hypothetical protein
MALTFETLNLNGGAGEKKMTRGCVHPEIVFKYQGSKTEERETDRYYAIPPDRHY